MNDLQPRPIEKVRVDAIHSLGITLTHVADARRVMTDAHTQRDASKPLDRMDGAIMALANAITLLVAPPRVVIDNDQE